jgi:hypothetical protein
MLSIGSLWSWRWRLIQIRSIKINVREEVVKLVNNAFDSRSASPDISGKRVPTRWPFILR